MAATPAFQRFYEEAARESDPVTAALVTAVARSETGDTAANAGLFTLGIDVRGRGGSGGSSRTIGNATHTFYAYTSGDQAVHGFFGFLAANPRYGFQSEEHAREEARTNTGGFLQRLVNAGYSGCGPNGTGPECDKAWGSKILNIIGGLGLGAVPPAENPTDIAPAPQATATGAVVGTAIDSGVRAVTGSNTGVQAAGSALANLISRGFWARTGFLILAVLLVIVGLIIMAVGLNGDKVAPAAAMIAKGA